MSKLKKFAGLEEMESWLRLNYLAALESSVILKRGENLPEMRGFSTEMSINCLSIPS